MLVCPQAPRGPDFLTSHTHVSSSQQKLGLSLGRGLKGQDVEAAHFPGIAVFLWETMEGVLGAPGSEAS